MTGVALPPGARRPSGAVAAYLALLAGGCETQVERSEPALAVAELGQVSVTYLHEELPALGLAQPPARSAGERPVALACSCDEDRIVVTAYFGTGWEGNTVRLALCRRGGVPELVAIDLIGSNDYSAPWFLPPATGSVLLRRDVPGELACAFDLKSASGGVSFVASGVIELEQCTPLDGSYGMWNPDTPLPECGADGPL